MSGTCYVCLEFVHRNEPQVCSCKGSMAIHRICMARLLRSSCSVCGSKFTSDLLNPVDPVVNVALYAYLRGMRSWEEGDRASAKIWVNKAQKICRKPETVFICMKEIFDEILYNVIQS